MATIRQAGLALVAWAVAAALTACGGGGGSSTADASSGSSAGGGSSGGGSSGGGSSGGGSSGGTVTPAAVTLSGTVASGAAFTGAQVTVTDRSGTVVGTSATVGTDGQYTVTLSSGALPPFVLTATRSTAAGETQTLVSVADATTDSSATVNITPVTHLIAARLSPSGDPAALAGAVAANPALASSSAVQTAVAEVNTVLAPVLAATGVSTVTNPLSVTITPNGTGYDRLLDTIQVTVNPTGAGNANIEVGIKIQQSEAAQPPVIQFTSNAPAATLQSAAASVGTVSSAAVLPSGTSALIADLLARLTACYALPLETRVNNASASDSAVTGTAANVAASACRQVFIGGDPAGYLSNGVRVGRGITGYSAFSGIFNRGATGLSFSDGSYEFTRANGDLVIGYKTRDSVGGEVFDSLVVRANSAGALEVVGNQFAYGGGVAAYHQQRHYVTADSTGASQAGYDFYSTGYTVNVPNTVDSQGRSIYDRVVVTTPRNSTLTLKPTSGGSVLMLVRSNNTVSSTSFIRVRSAYMAASTSGHPRDVETGLFFLNTDLSEDEVAAIPNQSVWQLAYFLAGNTGSTPDAVQTYKTRSRALTLAELATKGMATLTSESMSAALTQMTRLNNRLTLPTAAAFGPINYNVGANALPPTSVQVWGSLGTAASASGASFDDSVTVRSTASTATVSCSAATSSDLHCVGGSNGGYASYAYLSNVQLVATDAHGRGFSNAYAAYRLR